MEKTLLSINNQVRAKIVMQYIGQKLYWNDNRYFGILKSVTGDYKYYLVDCSLTLGLQHVGINIGCVEVKRLGEISNEDAIELASLFEPTFCNTYNVDIGRSIANQFKFNNKCSSIMTFNKVVESSDFLRSKGYAMPYGEYSVEDLIQAGIYKLID